MEFLIQISAQVHRKVGHGLRIAFAVLWSTIDEVRERDMLFASAIMRQLQSTLFGTLLIGADAVNFQSCDPRPCKRAFVACGCLP